MRFGKWLLKAIVSYAVFIAAGLLLSFVPAMRLGLSEFADVLHAVRADLPDTLC